MRTAHDPRPADTWPTPAAAPRPAGDTSLADYVEAFWRHRWLLLAVPIVAALAAYLTALTLTPRFEATATLVVSPSKTGEAVVPVSEVRNFRAVLDNQSLANQVVKEFKLNAEPYGLTAQRFLDRHITVEEVRGTNLIALGVTLYDPQLAARVANAMADRAVALSRSLEQTESVVARDLIKEQLDTARDRLTRARSALETYQRQAQVDLLQKKMDVLIDQQADLQQLLVDIRGERGYLQQAERDLSLQDRVRDVQRSVQIPPPAPRQPAERPTQRLNDEQKEADDRPRRSDPAPPPPVRAGVRDELIDPFINPAYEMLQQEVTGARSRLAQLEQKRDELLKARSADGQLPALAEFYTRKATEDELKMQKDLAEKIFTDVATRYEQARLQIASRSAQLQIVDAALPPDRKVYPREKLIAASAGVLTLSLLLAGILANTALGRLAWRRPVASEGPSVS